MKYRRFFNTLIFFILAECCSAQNRKISPRIQFFSPYIQADSIKVQCIATMPLSYSEGKDMEPHYEAYTGGTDRLISNGEVVGFRFFEYNNGVMKSSGIVSLPTCPKSFSREAEEEFFLKCVPYAYFRFVEFGKQERLKTDVAWCFPFWIYPEKEKLRNSAHK